MSHYYQNDPNLKDQNKQIKFYYKNISLMLETNSGVFSKSGIDYGTRVLLETFASYSESLDFSKKQILDIGCGYGVIGLALAKSERTNHVEMIDVNERAVELAKKNQLINQIENARIYESDLYANVVGEFDFIFSNPPIRAGKKIVHAIAEAGYDHLKNGGEIIFVIQKKQGAESLMKKLEEIFANVVILNKDKGYYIIKSRKDY